MKFKDGGLTRFEWDGVTRTLGNMWTLEKGDREMACRLVTHPLGWELRLMIGNDLFRTEVCKTEERVFKRAAEWESEAKTKGWQGV